MGGRLFAIIVAIASLAATASAQEPEDSRREAVSPRPAVDLAPFNASTDPLLKALLEKAALLTQQEASRLVKSCPMPVQRPDTSRLERIPVARPSAGMSFPMQRIELKCPNPLDTPR